jgi:UDP:flavonoid glycosyltransferase YjiC (YdhE family)
MSRILIAVIGSRGDVAPLTGLGTRLQQAGHDVVIASYAEFGDLVRGCGLPFRELHPARVDERSSKVDPVAGLRDFFLPRGQRAIGDNMIAALRDEPADVLLLSPLAELAGHPLAEAKGVPSIGVRLQPLSATSAYPPAVLGSWTAGRLLNRAASGLGAAAIDTLYGRVVAGFRRQLGLPDASASTLRRRRTDTDWPILYGYSPSVLPRPVDWRSGIGVTGYWWPVRPTQWQPPEELEAFLDAGPPPVFVGFGSVMKGASASAHLSDVVQKALRSVGARGVIQTGWAGLEASGSDMLTVGDVPHDWLFERVAAVVHHCGAGTAAAGLRAGVPAVGVPVAGDQPFWARRLRELGVSSATIPQRRLTADRLGSAMRTALEDTMIHLATTTLAASIAAEDGVGQAVGVVEGCLRRGRRPT